MQRPEDGRNAKDRSSRKWATLGLCVAVGSAPLLAFALNRGRLVAGLAVASLGAAAVAYLTLGKTFMPTMDEGDIIMQLEKLPSISLAQTIATDLRVQQAVIQHVPEVDRKSVV